MEVLHHFNDNDHDHDYGDPTNIFRRPNNNNTTASPSPVPPVAAGILPSSSLLSLVSIATSLSEGDYSTAEASFHTCYDDETMSSWTQQQQHQQQQQRVPSYACLLEDVVEETDSVGRDWIHSNSSNRDTNNNNNDDDDDEMDDRKEPSRPPSLSQPSLLIPLRSFSQMQAQPLSPRLTAARLALSSDIAMLTRGDDDTRTSTNTNTNIIMDDSTGSHHVYPYHHHHHHHNTQKGGPALPMSRSFATPRAAVGTVVRPSLSTASLQSLYSVSTRTSSFVSLKDWEEVGTTPAITAKPRTTKKTEAPPTPTLPPVGWSDLMDDVQLHIFQFLDVRDLRAVMAVQSPFRALMFTPDAHGLWQQHWQQEQQQQLGHDRGPGGIPHPLFQRAATMTATRSTTTLTRANDPEEELVLVDDLCLPTAARPRKSSSSSSSVLGNNHYSHWHHQANLSLLLSMAQPQPTDIDHEQLLHYTTWRGRDRIGRDRRTRMGRGRRNNNNNTNHQPPAGDDPVLQRLRPTNDHHNNNNTTTPLLQCHYSTVYRRSVVQFTGRVGQGDRCIRSNAPLPRPTLMTNHKDAYWVLPPNAHDTGVSGSPRHYSFGGSSSSSSSSGGHKRDGSLKRSFRSMGGNNSGGLIQASLMDLFCRKGRRAVAATRAAWRPFVAPFVSSSSFSLLDNDNGEDHHDTTTTARSMMTPAPPTAVHLTPRFVSYFEVSILEPRAEDTSCATKNHNVVGNNNTRHNNNNNNNNNNPVRGGSTDCVAVGLATESFDWHARMPGWDASSYGYHGDDGGIFHSSGGMLRKFGPSYGRGDVVGCGVDHVAGGIFFTLNGQFLGYAWTGLPDDLLQKDLYPIVGIDTNDFVHCNFGTEPFVYNLASMIVRHEDLVHQSLAASAASAKSS